MSRATLATLKAAIERGALKAAPVSQLAAYCHHNQQRAVTVRERAITSRMIAEHYTRNVGIYLRAFSAEPAIDHNPRNYAGPVMVAQGVRTATMRAWGVQS